MRKIVLLFLIPFVLLANEPINECITDIYFANGIMNSEEDAEGSLKLIKEEIQAKFYNGNETNILKHHKMTL